MIRKIVRGSRTEEDQNQMPNEDCSSHRSSVFTQIAEKKKMLFRQIVECRVFFYAQKAVLFEP